MTPTPVQKVAALPHVRYEIEALLLTPRHDSTDEAIVETVYFRKMAHARALLDFFVTPTVDRYRDDVLSEDFQFPARAIYPDSQDQEFRDRFNKDILHISYSRTRRDARTKEWPLQQMLPPIIDRALEFVRHVEGLTWQLPDAERQMWGAIRSRYTGAAPLVQSTANVASAQVVSVELKRKNA